MRYEVRRLMGRRVATFVAIALVHASLLVLLTLTRWTSPPTSQEPFVTHVFFITEVPPSVEESASQSPARTARRSTPRTAPITLPPEPPAHAAPGNTPPIDWAREAERSASRQWEKEQEARRLAAPFTHDYGAHRPARPAPEFGWDRTVTNRIEPLESGGTLIWINDRCAIVVAGGVLPICKIGKITARGDLFEHMNDPPVLGAEPTPP